MKCLCTAVIVCVAVLAITPPASATVLVSETFSTYTDGSYLSSQTATGTGLTGTWSGGAYTSQSPGLYPGSGGSALVGTTWGRPASDSVSTTAAVATATQGINSIYFSFEVYRMTSGWDQDFFGPVYRPCITSAMFEIKTTSGFSTNSLSVGVTGGANTTNDTPGTGAYYAGETIGDTTISATGGTYTNGTTRMIVGKYTRVAGSDNDLFQLFAVDPTSPGTEPTAALLTMNTKDVFGSTAGVSSIAISTLNGQYNYRTATADELLVGTTWGSVTNTIDPPVYIPGDVDGNGVVNGNDLNIILSNYGATSGMTWGTGDLDGSGEVNGNDLNIVLSTYGNTASVTTAVPEPGTLLLALAGLVGLVVYGRRKQK